MKILNTILMGCAALVLMQSASLAQSNTAVFNLNQPAQQLNLEQSDFETIYRTEQVPDTCYRQEVQGTRTECHTEYRQQCSTRYEQQCRYESYPVCRMEPRQSCYPVQECRTVMDRVCNSRGCTTVPRRECGMRQQCSTRMEQVCRNEQRQYCENVPRQYCENVPQQVCNQVPNVVTVPYACTRSVQVPAGQQLKLHTAARIDIQFANFSETGATPDSLVANLRDGQVTLTLQSGRTAQYLYQIIGQQRTEQVLSQTEKVVNVQLIIKAVSIQKLQAFLSSQIVDSRLYRDRLDFTLLGALNVPVKGHLLLLIPRGVRADIVVVDSDFSSNALVTQGNVTHLMMNNFGISNLNYANYSVNLKLMLDIPSLQQGLINPESLGMLSIGAVQSQFQSYPN